MSEEAENDEQKAWWRRLLELFYKVTGSNSVDIEPFIIEAWGFFQDGLLEEVKHTEDKENAIEDFMDYVQKWALNPPYTWDELQATGWTCRKILYRLATEE